MAEPALAPPDVPLPVRLRVLRLRAGLSQTELAAELGLHPSSVSSYESGRRQPRDPAAFEARVREAVGDRFQQSETPSPPAPGVEILDEPLSLEAAHTCLDLIGRLADAYGLEVEARLHRDIAADTYRLRVRVAAPSRPRAAGASTT